VAGWKRSLYVLWFVQFMTITAMTLGLTFVPFFLEHDPALNVTDEADRLLYTSLIFAGPFFTTILTTPIWGWLADRSGRKRQVVRAAVGLGVSQVLMGFAQSPGELVAIRIAQGLVSGVVAANLGLISAVTPEEEQGRALSILQSATPAGLVFGPVIGGALASSLGYRPVFWLLGGVILLMGLLAALLLREEGFMPTRAPNPFRGLYETARHVLAAPPMRFAFAVLFTTQVAWTIAQGVFAIYAGELIERTVFEQGLATSWWNLEVGFTAIGMTLTGLANFLMSHLWGRAFDQGRRYLTVLGAGLLAATTAVLALWPPWWIVLLARLGIGAGFGGAATLQYPTISARVPREERGQFMGLATATVNAGNLVGFVASGFLAQVMGESGNFLVAAVLYLCVCLAAVRAERGGR
jgi:MFS family permease